jgi:hypothetical protein
VIDGRAIDYPRAASQDERVQPRYVGRLEAFLLLRGARWCCWIRDLSIDGAGLEPALPPALDQIVELTSPGFDFEGALRGRVINLAHRRSCVAFDLDPEMRDKLARFLAANVDPD